MVAEIRLNFMRVAEFWKQHTERTCIENVMELERSAISAVTVVPFEVALIKCETESQHSDEINFIADNRSSTSQQVFEKKVMDDTVLSPSKSKNRGRPPEISSFKSFECEICGKVTKTK